MLKTLKSDIIDSSLLKRNPKIIEDCINAQRAKLLTELPIEDNKPIIITLRSCSDTNSRDPLSTVISTQLRVEAVPVQHIVFNRLVGEDYKEHKGFWAKLKLLFSKKPIYTKDIKEI